MEPPTVETSTVSSFDQDAASGPHNAGATTTFCITGMHRSGTSMVARLLHACGMFLGPDDELSQPVVDNPAGYFEHPEFLKLNEDILAQLGGSWNEPPALTPGWESNDELGPFFKRAENLLSQSRRRYWGWKDPRTSLTLPFWKKLIPDLKVVVCVRNPVEVMHSLIVRGNSQRSSQFQLWLAYYRQLLSAAGSQDYLVTHYRSYFQNSHAELRRVLHLLGAEVSDKDVDNACAHISTDLRHHFVTTAELVEADVSDELLGIYFNLCAEAGPVYGEVRKHEEPDLTDARKNEINSLVNALRSLRTEHETLKQTQTEILNSKAFRLASWYWRLRGGK
ncbi:MAG TPA: sulfotransferase [Pyrinomonadaceae bacterium]|jgi:hypothetical protein|nr:sulfotransferase [Pyrinomonadaceae bacterium]